MHFYFQQEQVQVCITKLFTLKKQHTSRLQKFINSKLKKWYTMMNSKWFVEVRSFSTLRKFTGRNKALLDWKQENVY